MQRVLASIILLVLGLLLLMKPKLVWKYGESWKNKTVTEPSDLYLVIIRIVGCIIMIGGILAYFIP